MGKEETKGAGSDEMSKVKTLLSQKILDPYAPIIGHLHNNRCEKCGTTENLYVHLRDGDIKNRSLDNLTLLCYKCKLEADRLIFRSILYDMLGTIYQEKEKEILPPKARVPASSERKG